MREDDLKVIRKYYSTIARIYDDAIYVKIPKEMVEEQRVLEDLLNNLNLLDPIIDLGCGTGKWTKKLLEKGHNVIGVDISPEMIKIAKAKGVENIILSNIQNTPFEDNSFGTVTSFWTLQHMLTYEDLKLAVKEMCRLVNEKGMIIICENVYNIEGKMMNIKHLDIDQWTIEWGLEPLPVYRRITNPREIAEKGFYKIDEMVGDTNK